MGLGISRGAGILLGSNLAAPRLNSARIQKAYLVNRDDVVLTGGAHGDRRHLWAWWPLASMGSWRLRVDPEPLMPGGAPIDYVPKTSGMR